MSTLRGELFRHDNVTLIQSGFFVDYIMTKIYK